jgi:hypothetical protein
MGKITVLFPNSIRTVSPKISESFSIILLNKGVGPGQGQRSFAYSGDRAAMLIWSAFDVNISRRSSHCPGRGYTPRALPGSRIASGRSIPELSTIQEP